MSHSTTLSLNDAKTTALSAQRRYVPALEGAETVISSMELLRLEDWMKSRQATHISTADATSVDLKQKRERVLLIPATRPVISQVFIFGKFIFCHQ